MGWGEAKVGKESGRLEGRLGGVERMWVRRALGVATEEQRMRGQVSMRSGWRIVDAGPEGDRERVCRA